MTAGNQMDPIEARVLFDHDRKCCVCRECSGKHIQIHHIDGNHDNNDVDNLSVLCLDCHTETQLKGGFGRKLSPEELKLYRDDWVATVRDTRRHRPTAGKPKCPLLSSPPSDPLAQFLDQFTTQGIVPMEATFSFPDYSFNQPGFPTIVITSTDMDSENGMVRGSAVKAYLQCVLGLIPPYPMFQLDTVELNDGVAWSVRVGEEGSVVVPWWSLVGFSELGHFRWSGLYYPEINQILLTLMPAMVHTRRNYDLLTLKMEPIMDQMIGRSLEL